MKHKPTIISDFETRAAEGRRRRNIIGRAAQAHTHPEGRTFDPIAVIRQADQGRIKRLLPVRRAHMSASCFAFFRGTAAVMAADLGRMPHTGLEVQLCGDAHLENLGSFATPDGQLVFDFNDFDETARGPWEWDLKRLATSVVLAGIDARLDAISYQSAAATCVRAYCHSIKLFSATPVLEVGRHQIQRGSSAQPIHDALRMSERARPLDLLKKLTTLDDKGARRFRSKENELWPVTGIEARRVLDSLALYGESLAPERRHMFHLFRVVDVGFKVVGTGSVGTKTYVVLLEGNGPSDPLFLQIKEERPSVYAPWLAPIQPPPHQGRRAALGQRTIQPVSDLLLGWTRIGTADFLVRQLNDHKGTVETERIDNGGLKALAGVAGELLARGHARSGDACAIDGYCGSGGKISVAIADFAVAYAAQTGLDFRQFLETVGS